MSFSFLNAQEIQKKWFLENNQDEYITFENSQYISSFNNDSLVRKGDYIIQSNFLFLYENQADVKVFVVNYENQADLMVYKVNYENQAGKNNGKWFFTKYENQAKKKLYFVRYENQAELKIFFVEYENQAGWRNKSKQYLLY